MKMNINRNNYEEYFLMYADNELTAAEKKVVDIFVQENKDLKEEFLMIQMTVNKPEKQITLKDKSFLFKTLPSFINESNRDEVFVQYHDGELSEGERLETEKFLQDHPAANAEFELIGKAKLMADESVVYPNKKELYKRVNAGKVIPMIWWRSAAAAVVIGVGLWVAFGYLDNTSKVTPVASSVNKKQEQPLVAATKPATETKDKKQPEIADQGLVADHKLNNREEKKFAVHRSAVRDDEQKKIGTKEIVKIVSVPGPDYHVALNAPVKKVDEAPVNTVAMESMGDHEIKPDTDTEKTNYAQTASYINPDNKNENYVFYDVSTDELKKSKLGGFLKKVRRIVERNNPVARLLGEEEQMAAK